MSEDLRDERLGRLYRESDRAEPSSALDAAILAAARAAVAPVPRRRPGRRAWMLPTSLAATVALAVGLTLLVQQKQERRGGDWVKAEAPATAASKRAETEVAAPSVPQERAAAAQEKNAAALLPAARQEEAARVAPPPVRPVPDAPLAPSVVAPPSAPAAADAIGPRAKAMAPLRKEAASLLGAARAPEPWLEDIRRLRREDKKQEAAEALAAFRKAYPDYRLPDDLRTD